MVFDYADRKWKWSIEQLYAMQYMENVVEFVIAKIRKLPESTQKMIQLAACVGNSFNARELMTVAECQLVDCQKHLSTAVSAGYLQVIHRPTAADPWAELDKTLIPSSEGEDDPSPGTPTSETSMEPITPKGEKRRTR